MHTGLGLLSYYETWPISDGLDIRTWIKFGTGSREQHKGIWNNFSFEDVGYFINYNFLNFLLLSKYTHLF